MKLSKEQTSFLAVDEGNSIVAHDFSGQIHVAQFCIEQLSDLVDESGKKSLSTLKESIAKLELYNDGFRNFLRSYKSLSSQDTPTFGEFHKRNLSLLEIYYMKGGGLSPVNFSLDPEAEDITIENHGEKILAIVFSLYCSCFELIKDKDLGSANFLIKGLTKEDGSINWQILLENDEKYLDENFLLPYFERGAIIGKSSSFRSLGNDWIKVGLEQKYSWLKIEIAKNKIIIDCKE